MDERIDGWMDEWVDGRMDGCMDGGMDGCMDGLTNGFTFYVFSHCPFLAPLAVALATSSTRTRWKITTSAASRHGRCAQYASSSLLFAS